MSTYCAEVLSPAGGSRPTKILLIRERPDGFHVEQLDQRGELLGDSLYETLDDAMHDAYSEHGPLSEWRFCPDGVDPLDYIRGRSG